MTVFAALLKLETQELATQRPWWAGSSRSRRRTSH